MGSRRIERDGCGSEGQRAKGARSIGVVAGSVTGAGTTTDLRECEAGASRAPFSGM